MSYPKTIDVLVEGEDTEVKATRQRTSAQYRSALYLDEKGREFWIDESYMSECVAEHKAPFIHLQVIAKNHEIQEKLKFAQAQLDRLGKEKQSGLVLPPGYEQGVKV